MNARTAFWAKLNNRFTTMEDIANYRIEVKQVSLSEKELVELAWEQLCERMKQSRGDAYFRREASEAPADVVLGAVCGYLRHKLTNYDSLLKMSKFTHPTCPEYKFLRQRVCMALKEAFPVFSDVL